MNDVKIPQVNAGATDRNREQTLQILRLLGQVFDYDKFLASPASEQLICFVSISDNVKAGQELPRRSFTIDQVVEMLEAQDVRWLPFSTDAYGPEIDAAWYRKKDCRYWENPLVLCENPFDLTGAMDVLIKVYEEKEKEQKKQYRERSIARINCSCGWGVAEHEDCVCGAKGTLTSKKEKV